MDCNALMILHCKCVPLGSEWGGLNGILNTPVLHYPPKLSKYASVLSNWYCTQSYYMVVQCCVAGVLECKHFTCIYII